MNVCRPFHLTVAGSHLIPMKRVDLRYMRSFPGCGGMRQISNAAGTAPVWSHNGRDLFFQNLDDRIKTSNCDDFGILCQKHVN